MEFVGEHVSPKIFSRGMEWIDFEEGGERLETGFFLARFGDTIGYCTMNEDGDVFALDDVAGNDEPSKPVWRRAEPDMVLVPVGS